MNEFAQPPGQPRKGPFVQRCAPGKHAWCRCRRSSTYPLCDGTHRGTDTAPLKVVLEAPQTMVWCACGETGNAPYCDGSHARL
ncbi:MAG: CDGSH iron-sulfur domain-containing protein [Planctomycetota bacterium]